jgi:hypothetical protein
MYVEGRVLDSKGGLIPGAVIDTWETDESGEQHLDVSFLFPLMAYRRGSQPFRPLRYPVHRSLRTGLSW